MKTINEILIESVIILALISIPEAIPVLARSTDAVLVLVTGVLVTPSPTPATRSPGSMVSQLGVELWLPHHIKRNPMPMVSKPQGITTLGLNLNASFSPIGGKRSVGRE